MSLSTRIADERSQREKARSMGWREFQKRYIEAPSWQAKLHAYDNFHPSQGQIKPTFLAQAAFELAARVSDQNLSDRLLSEAVGYLNFAKRSLSTAVERIKLGKFIANVPLLTSIHLEGDHPERQHVQHAIRDSVGLLAERKVNQVPLAYRQEYVGELGEICLSTMLQFYSDTVLQSGSYTPVPSLLSEDQSKSRGSLVNNSWDVSIFTEYNEDPTYKIQAKYGAVHKEQPYAYDITCVNLKYDLRFPREDVLPINKLMFEITEATSDTPDKIARHNVLARTEMLLEKLG